MQGSESGELDLQVFQDRPVHAGGELLRDLAIPCVIREPAARRLELACVEHGLAARPGAAGPDPRRHAGAPSSFHELKWREMRLGDIVNRSREVDRYMATAPEVAQTKLRQVRAAIREAAPDAVESVSYGMPHYSFRGESGFQSRLCYFGLMKDKKRISFYTRPGFLEEYQDEVAPYLTAKSALQFSLERPIPVPLIRRLVRNAVRKHALAQS